MKKILFVLVSLLLVLNCYSQTIFKCDSVENDFNTWEELAKKYKKKGNKKWAEEIAKVFPLSEDGTIKWQYVIEIDSIINIQDYEDYVREWVKLEYTNVVPICDKINHSLHFEATMQNIGKSQGLFQYTLIWAKQSVKIDFKDTKIRITINTNHYNLSSAGLGGIDTPTTTINNAFPYNKKSSYKDAYAMAYININSNELSKCKSLFLFLNKHIKTINEDQDNW